MKLRQIQTVALTFLLVLLPTIGKSQRDGGSPIIVGDGSVHIRSVQWPFDSAGKNWDTGKRNEYRRLGLGAAGHCLNVSLVGRTGADWSKFDTIAPPLFDFTTNTDNKCIVELTITGPDVPKTEKITIQDEKGKRGMVVTSSIGLTGVYKKDPKEAELVRTTANKITGIAIRTHINGPSVGPTPQDIAKRLADCRSNPKYSSCGVLVEYK